MHAVNYPESMQISVNLREYQFRDIINSRFRIIIVSKKQSKDRSGKRPIAALKKTYSIFEIPTLEEG